MPGRTATLTAVVRRSVATAQPIAQAYAEGNMTAAVLVTRVGGNTFDRSSGGWVPGARTEIYRGPAHIATVSGGATYNLGDEQQYYDSTQVSVPLGHEVWVNDDVQVLEHPSADLVGKHYRVTALNRGGLIPDCLKLSVTGTEPAPNQAGS